MGVAALGGCVLLLYLVYSAPHGQDRPSGQITCAPLIGEAPPQRWSGNGDLMPGQWVTDDGTTANGDSDLRQVMLICEQRRSTRLVQMVLVAVPTAAFLGAWISTSRPRDGERNSVPR